MKKYLSKYSSKNHLLRKDVPLVITSLDSVDFGLWKSWSSGVGREPHWVRSLILQGVCYCIIDYMQHIDILLILIFLDCGQLLGIWLHINADFIMAIFV